MYIKQRLHRRAAHIPTGCHSFASSAHTLPPHFATVCHMLSPWPFAIAMCCKICPLDAV